MIFNDLIGYLATTIVASSFLMKRIHALRIVNSIGAFLFVIYGIMIKSYPVCFTNTFILSVNIFHIFKNLKHNSQKAKVVI